MTQRIQVVQVLRKRAADEILSGRPVTAATPPNGRGIEAAITHPAISGRQHSLKCATGKRCRPVCPVVQQEEIESIPTSSYECIMVHCVLCGMCKKKKDLLRTSGKITEEETSEVLCVECGIVWEGTWTLRRNEEKRIEAFEMWMWRKRYDDDDDDDDGGGGGELLECHSEDARKNTGYKLVSNRHQLIQVTEHQETEPETSNSVISPEDIRKVPVIEPSFSNRRGTAVLVTSTPHKNSVHTAVEKKRKVNESENQKQKQTRRNLNVDFCTTIASQPAALVSTKRSAPKQTKMKIFCESSSDSESDDEDNNDEDVVFPLCGKNFHIRSKDRKGSNTRNAALVP
ncbi:hypothetical protein ANN_02914 [Periplaneta americana]|uniref:Uncharacterized protein n=1 Tax=Periplaneta americana TaxID=6978 RepID=A0ABQ8TXL9_PERAM|nr:hypothetical protein ANN_02914 [Periplaneta americana]